LFLAGPPPRAILRNSPAGGASATILKTALVDLILLRRKRRILPTFAGRVMGGEGLANGRRARRLRDRGGGDGAPVHSGMAGVEFVHRRIGVDRSEGENERRQCRTKVLRIVVSIV